MSSRILILLCAPLVAAGCIREQTPGAGTPVAETPERRELNSIAVLTFPGYYDPPNAVASEAEWRQKLKRLSDELLPDDLSNRLAAKLLPESVKLIPASVVRSRPDESRKLRAEPPLAAGKRFGVDAVLTGVLGSNGQLSVQLLDVSSGELLWGSMYHLRFSSSPGRWSVDFPEGEVGDVVDHVAGVVSARRRGQ